MAVLKTTNRKGVVIYHLDPQPGGKSPLEMTEAINLYTHVKHKYPEIGLLFFHVANESNGSSDGKKNWGHIQNRLQMGVVSGPSDYMLLIPRGGFNYMVLELKRAVKKQSSPIKAEQVLFLKQCEEAGGFACVCYGWRAAIAAIDEYMALQSI